MRAPVTGGGEFIGHHLMRSLLDRGDRVSVIGDLSTGLRARLEPLLGPRNLGEGSILDPEARDDVIASPEVIFDEAAIPSIARSLVTPALTKEVNVTRTVEVVLLRVRHELIARRRGGVGSLR